MDNATKAQHYQELAADWEKQASHESGKTLENGWTSRELHAATSRRDHCLAKRDACIAKARELLAQVPA